MEDIRCDAVAWLQEFEDALATRSHTRFRMLFAENCNWRDLVAFTWNIRQFHGRDAIENYLFAVAQDVRPHHFSIDDQFPHDPFELHASEPQEVWEVNFRFRTEAGSGDGLVHLVRDDQAPSRWRAIHFFTRLLELEGVKPRWPQFGRMTREELEAERIRHEERKTYSNSEPDVLVVGGGHNGLFMGAELERLGVENVVIDSWPNAGDVWRQRYSSLVLHMPRGMMHFPHMPFPVTIPDFVTKDRLADWFAGYINALDINLWTSTELLAADYDGELERWNARLRLADGSERVLHPRELVLATGLSGTPKIPQLPGLADFAGPVVHSSAFKSGADFAGKRALVVGVGTSAHDIAFDIVKNGGKADMLQKSPIGATDITTAYKYWNAYNSRDIETAVADKRSLAGRVLPVMLDNLRRLTVVDREADRELLEGLERAGMRLDWGEYGWQYKYFEAAAGYYLNVGASEAVIDGRIGIRQLADLQRLTGSGACFVDDEEVPYDIIVLATGYEPPTAACAALFGPEVAEQIGRIAGFDEYGETDRNLYRPIPGAPHLFINAGGVAPARWFAPIVGLLIKAELQGVIPEKFLALDHPSRGPLEPVLLSKKATEAGILASSSAL